MIEIRNIQLLRTLVYRLRHLRNHFSYKSGRNNTIRNKGIMISTKYHIGGNDNSLIINRGGYLGDCRIHIVGRNNTIEVEERAYLEQVELWIEDDDCKIVIGEGTFIGNNTHLACTEDGSEISIGKHCMISSYVQVRTGDSHSILDSEGTRINYAQSVHISDHVWIGEGAKVLKGARLGQDSVVSTGAIVTKDFGNNLLVAGIPAKIIKENINWNSERIKWQKGK